MGTTTFFLPSLGIGGAERVTVDITNRLAQRGYNIEILLVNKQGKFLDQVESDINVVELDGEPFFDGISALRTYLIQNDVENLVSSMTGANLMSILATKTIREDVRHIAKIESVPSKKSKSYTDGKSKIVPYLMKGFYRMGQEFLCVSNGARSDLVSNYSVSKEKVHVIHNPCLNDKMSKLADESIECEWLTNPNKKVILSVGRLSEPKDFTTLIKSFVHVQSVYKNARLIIVGDGPKRSKLESLAVDVGIGNKVRFTGHKNNPYPYFSNADVFVLSSNWEGFGIVLVEAMAFGTPVVSTNCPFGPAEILQNGELGELVEPNSVEQISESLIKTINNNDIEGEKLKQRSTDFHISEITDEYESLLFNE